MLEARELTKTYGSTTGENRPALDRLTLFVPGGKIFCLLGPNGADKTTTINLFLNFIEPTSGEAIACGANAAERADIVGYGLFWTLLAAAIKGRRMDSALNALTLMTCFVVVTLILPAAINAIASAAYPPPSRAEMVLAARAATTDADREQDAALARYADEHPDATAEEAQRGSNAERSAGRLAVQEAATARVEAVMAAHDAQLRHQHELANRLGFASPALLIYRAVADSAGTGEARYSAFLSRVDDFRKAWRDFFLERARKGKSLNESDYEKLPRFEQAREETAPGDALRAFQLSVTPLVLLCAFRFGAGFRDCKLT